MGDRRHTRSPLGEKMCFWMFWQLTCTLLTLPAPAIAFFWCPHFPLRMEARSPPRHCSNGMHCSGPTSASPWAKPCCKRPLWTSDIGGLEVWVGRCHGHVFGPQKVWNCGTLILTFLMQECRFLQRESLTFKVESHLTPTPLSVFSYHWSIGAFQKWRRPIKPRLAQSHWQVF